MKLLLLLIFSLLLFGVSNAANVYDAKDFCKGNDPILIHEDEYRGKNFDDYKKMFDENVKHFKNCKIIVGNLIIAYNFKKEYFANIEEVTGYIKFYDVADEIIMDKLRVIHGETLDKKDGSFIFEGVTTDVAAFLKLGYIKRGLIIFRNAPNLCYWKVSYEKSLIYKQFVTINDKSYFRDHVLVDDLPSQPATFSSSACKKDPQCSSGTECFSNNIKLFYFCQKDNCYLKSNGSETTCPPCDGKRCFEKDKMPYCYTCGEGEYMNVAELKCQKGCTGVIYGQYCYNDVDICKDGWIKEGQQCKPYCSEEFTASDDFKICEKCNGTCPKTCNLNIDDNNPRQLDFGSVREIYPYYSYQNFDESENPIDENNLCKIIIGDLQITENTFHSVGGRGALPYSSLWFLNNVEVITGKLKISMGERKYFGLLKNVQHVKTLEAEDKNIIDLIQSNLFAQLNPISGEDCACPSPNLSTDKCVFAGHCRRT